MKFTKLIDKIYLEEKYVLVKISDIPIKWLKMYNSTNGFLYGTIPHKYLVYGCLMQQLSIGNLCVANSPLDAVERRKEREELEELYYI